MLAFLLFLLFILALTNGRCLCVARLLKTLVWRGLLVDWVSGTWRKMVDAYCWLQLLVSYLDWQAGITFYTETWSPYKVMFAVLELTLSPCQWVLNWPVFAIYYLHHSFAGVLFSFSHPHGLASIWLSVFAQYLFRYWSVGWLFGCSLHVIVWQLFLSHCVHVCGSDETLRLSCGAVIHAINEQSPDVLQKHSSVVLPLVFFAMHQRTGQTLKLWPYGRMSLLGHVANPYVQ